MKSYCTEPCISINVGFCVAPMLKVLVFTSLYLWKMCMNLSDTLPVVRCWSEVLCCTILTHLRDLEVRVMGMGVDQW